MYYNSSSMPFITSQPSSRQDVPASVLEANAIAVTLANEWENEWNQSGLASRLSREVGVVINLIWERSPRINSYLVQQIWWQEVFRKMSWGCGPGSACFKGRVIILLANCYVVYIGVTIPWTAIFPNIDAFICNPSFKKLSPNSGKTSIWSQKISNKLCILPTSRFCLVWRQIKTMDWKGYAHVLAWF